jgi:hypothetical protein
MKTSPEDAVNETPLGWITPLVRKLAYWAAYPRRICIGEYSLSELSELNLKGESVRRARRGDTFLAVCLLLDLAGIFLIDWRRPLGRCQSG